MSTAAPSATASLAEWLSYQEGLHPRSIALGLDRVGVVAGRLGLLQQPAPTLTVAGTNGKGSSATLAALIYRHAGYRTGLYTSPHLLLYNERINVDGVDASDDELCAAFAAIEAFRDEVPLTYFEYGTLAVLWCFRERQVEVQVLEVGLGGRLDAVNLVDSQAALVTSIGIDHTDWLGPDRESIGREKAHVFRSHRPAICADLTPPASIAEHAHAIGADLHLVGRDFRFEASPFDWAWHGRAGSMNALPMPGLGGQAQLRNAAGVLAAVETLQPLLPVPEPAIRRALPQLSLRGRFERSGRTIFDVAHNAEAAQELAQRLAEELPGQRVHLVLGMLSDKPVENFCRQLAAQVHRAYCIGLASPRGLPADALCRRVMAAGIEAEAFQDFGAALESADRAAGVDGWVVVTGSFLTVAAGLSVGKNR
ncbi:MAG: bifunctional tetrahydrofolate synthase/dihydrofolate synthase [Panacagrimonas sp.]